VAEEQIIRIDPDGNVTFLTHGDDPLLEIGEPTIVRASHVRFDNEDKLWYVYLRLNETEMRIRPGHKTRKEALAGEVKICQHILETRPDDVEEMFEVGQVEDEFGRMTSG
jgi:hypothetical protein